MGFKEDYPKAFLAIVIIIPILFLVGLALALYYIFKGRSQNQDKKIIVPAPTMVFLANDRRNFYSIHSTDMKLGRTNDGALVTDEGKVIEAGIPASIDGLEAYPPTYPSGHPYYNKDGSWGKLVNHSWKRYTDAYPSTNYFSTIFKASELNNGTSIVVVEANVSGKGEYTYAPVICDVDLNVEGIVVRHGGVLLVSNNVKTIQTQFILVESGGLFQIGSHFDDNYRFSGDLTIQLMHTDQGGFNALGTVSSQYSYKIYHPGVTNVTDESSNQLITDFSGEQLAHNTFGAKVFGCGFNGTVEMSGNIPPAAPYNGTWEVTNASSGSVFLGKEDFTTWLDASNSSNQALSELVDIPLSYPSVWARLSDAIFNKGDTTIKLDASDVGEWLERWTEGSKIIISGRNPIQYTVEKDPWGLLPFWFDCDNKADRDANTQANKDFIAPYDAVVSSGQENPPRKEYGHEIATIKSVDAKTGVITLKEGLQFVHDSRHTVSTRTIPSAPGKVVKSIKIPTVCHVGLLTRSIKLTSYLSSGGNGANVLPSQRPVPAKGVWQGPGGAVVCNHESRTEGAEVFAQCYKGLAENNFDYCKNMDPRTLTVNGSYIFGTTGLTGPNTALGGHSMWRYGSSTHSDGVEMSKFGQPGMFGSIARYGYHFHLAGFPQWWNGYLLKSGETIYGTMPDITTLSDKDAKIWRRQAMLCNGSGYSLFNRHCSIHGTSGVVVRNQVSFYNYGSNFFVEDGTEVELFFDHILTIATMQCLYDTYANPIPISGLVASDLAIPSAFWFKSNQVHVLRNVVCGIASGAVAFWYIPQNISALRGPSTVIVGNGELKLPGTASAGNSDKLGVRGFLSQNLNDWEDIKSEASLTKPCWVPQEFIDLARAGKNTGCSLFNIDNSRNPMGMFAENVVYQCFAFSNFPEFLAKPPVGMNNATPSFATTPNFNFAGPDSVVGFTPWPQFQPSNGQNSCTDSSAVSQSVYTQAQWGGTQPDDFPFQPLSQTVLEDYKTNNLARTENIGGTMLPYVIAGMLMYSSGGAGTLEPGAWSKQTGVFFIACTFVESTYANSKPEFFDRFCETTQGAQPPFALMATSTNDGVAGGGGIQGFNPSYSATFQVSAGGDGNQVYGALFHAFHNCIFTGGWALPSNSSVFGMQKSFIGDGVKIVSSEFNVNKGALNQLFCYDLPEGVTGAIDLFPPHFWQGRASNLSDIVIFDKKNQKAWRIFADEGRKADCTLGTEPVLITPFPPRANEPPTRKYPYVFDDDFNLLKITSSSDPTFNVKRPDWVNIAVNANVRSFMTPKAIEIGNTIGQQMALIPKCMLPISGYNTNICCSFVPGFDMCA